MRQARRQPGSAEPAIYRIQVRGRLDASWSEWLDGMAVSAVQGAGGEISTTLTGPLADQAALRGILNRLWDLNLSLISVARVDLGRDVHGGEER